MKKLFPLLIVVMLGLAGCAGDCGGCGKRPIPVPDSVVDDCTGCQ